MVVKKILLMRNSSNHIKFIPMNSRNEHTFFDVVVPYVLSQQDIQENLRFSTCPSWPLAATRVQPGSGHQGSVSPVFPFQWLTNEEWAKFVGLPSEKNILHRWFIYSWIENSLCGTLTSYCCCAADGRYPNYYHSRAPYYHDLFFTWWKVFFSVMFKHLLPYLTVTPMRDLEKPLQQFHRDWQGRLGGRPFRRSRLNLRKAIRVLWHRCRPSRQFEIMSTKQIFSLCKFITNLLRT